MPYRAVVVFWVVALVLVSGPPVAGDDVPDEVRPLYEKALDHLAKGQLKKAFSAVSRAKGKNPDSVDFWELYVRVWRAQGKKESTLWEKLVPKAEQRLKGSPVFHLLRHRLATDPEERAGHLKTALEARPGSTELRMLLAREYLEQEEEDLAEEVLDQVLEKEPANATALAMKGELLIESGLERSALAYAEEALEKQDAPALHDLLARALLAVSVNDASLLDRAAEEAGKAVATGDDWRFDLTLANILDRQGKTEAAATLLAETYEKTKAGPIGARLGVFAFRTGDYVQALKGLSLDRDPGEETLKAIAVCHARLGAGEAAHKVLARLLAEDDGEEMRMFAAGVDLRLDDLAAVHRHLEGQDGDGPTYYRAWADAEAGKLEEVKQQVTKERAGSGTRGGEEWLIPVALAALKQKLGPKASEASTILREAFVAAAKAGVATATVPEEEPLVTARSLGFMLRSVSYRVCLSGEYFDARPNFELSQREVDGKTVVVAGLTAVADCERDSQRTFPFRPGEGISGDDVGQVMMELMGPNGASRWETTSAGFGAGCAALFDGEWGQAAESFGEAVSGEPSWGRARLFRAVALAMEGTDLAGAATEAEIAAKSLVDDWDGRGVGILVRLLAGQDVAAEAKALAERRESLATRRLDEL